MLFLPDAEVLAVRIVCGGDQIVDQIQLGDDMHAAIRKRGQLAAVDELIDPIFAKWRPFDDFGGRQHVGRAAQELRVLLV